MIMRRASPLERKFTQVAGMGPVSAPKSQNPRVKKKQVTPLFSAKEKGRNNFMYNNNLDVFFFGRFLTGLYQGRRICFCLFPRIEEANRRFERCVFFFGFFLFFS